MGADAWITVGLVALMVLAMMRNLAGPDMILTGGLSILLALEIVNPTQAFAGFANTGMLPIAVLFVVAAGVQETGGLDFVVTRALGQPRSVPVAQLRMMVPVAGVSAFLNNTPVVAMMVPIVTEWSRRIGINPGKLFIPLSYAAIVGGSCTIIGTATNLVVYGLTQQRMPELHVPLFEISQLGLPAAVASMAYIALASRWLLPERGSIREVVASAREYTVAMRVEDNAPVAGKTIEDAGLRQLPALFLIEIERSDGEIRPAPGPNVHLRAGDRLLFAGVIDSVRDLQRIRGLVPVEGDQARKLADPRPNRRLVEAVVAGSSRLTRQNVRESRFRTHYNAAIIAVHRQGERLREKIGDIVPEAGDTLLLDTGPGFLEAFRDDPTFALVSEVENSAPRLHERAPIATGLLLSMVAVSAFGLLPLLTAAMLAAGLMVATRCITPNQARKAIDLRVLLTIASAFGVGAALKESGAAAVIAQEVVAAAEPFGPIGLLTAIYATTMVLSAVVTTNAGAVLMFPIAYAAAERAGIEFKPFMYCLMLAASANFMTPIGYQTNLMVYGPGHYRFSDFTRFGLPLQVLVGIVTVGPATVLWL